MTRKLESLEEFRQHKEELEGKLSGLEEELATSREQHKEKVGEASNTDPEIRSKTVTGNTSTALLCVVFDEATLTIIVEGAMHV